MNNFIIVHKDIYPHEPIAIALSSIVYFKDNYIQLINGAHSCKEFYSEITNLIKEKEQENVV